METNLPKKHPLSKKAEKEPCQDCERHTSGVIHNYPWQECSKNWSDKQYGQFVGVLHNSCTFFVKRK